MCAYPAERREKTSIVSIVNIAGADQESISLRKPVKAAGNIEDWLGALEKAMQVNLESESRIAHRSQSANCAETGWLARHLACPNPEC